VEAPLLGGSLAASVAERQPVGRTCFHILVAAPAAAAAFRTAVAAGTDSPVDPSVQSAAGVVQFVAEPPVAEPHAAGQSVAAAVAAVEPAAAVDTDFDQIGADSPPTLVLAVFVALQVALEA